LIWGSSGRADGHGWSVALKDTAGLRTGRVVAVTATDAAEVEG
jgi:hypothetical protein